MAYAWVSVQNYMYYDDVGKLFKTWLWLCVAWVCPVLTIKTTCGWLVQCERQIALSKEDQVVFGPQNSGKCQALSTCRPGRTQIEILFH